jgi:hypothetical protein
MSVVERLLLVIVFIVGGMLGDQAPGDDLFVVRCEAKSVLLIDVTFDTSKALRGDIKSHFVLPLLEKVCYVFIPKKHFAAQLVLLLQCVDG